MANALQRTPVSGTVLDVGCGTGSLCGYVQEQFEQYVGADAVHYDAFPVEQEFHAIDLDSGRVPVSDGFADEVKAVEVIEHLENPRQFARELTRLAKPGGWIVVTTPNQLSLLSKLTLIVFNEFNTFRAGSYPAHLTALLEVDLRRIARECGWVDVQVQYTGVGRVPGTAWHWPRWMSHLAPRALSDNVVVVARKPGSQD
ncbi:methyltransferase domain-containing protein [bacterium]|nr:methyltransferase domain-containing protein [bacterium]